MESCCSIIKHWIFSQISSATAKTPFCSLIGPEKNCPETNTTKIIIFTVVIDFDSAYDIEFLQDISSIFLEANQEVYFVELVAALRERLKRNVHEERLKAKPSKRDTKFSRKEILTSARKNRLESRENEVKKLFPAVKHLKINNTKLAPKEVCTQIISELV